MKECNDFKLYILAKFFACSSIECEIIEDKDFIIIQFYLVFIMTSDFYSLKIKKIGAPVTHHNTLHAYTLIMNIRHYLPFRKLDSVIPFFQTKN